MFHAAPQSHTRNIADAKWQGHEFFIDKDPHHTRVMFHNINGLTLHGTKGLDMLVNDQINMQIDVQAISEHCLDTSKFQVLHQANKVLRECTQQQTTLHLASCAEAALHQYKPGGTGLLLVGNITGRLEPQGRGGDDMGRWSYLHLRRRQLPPVTIISAYQVCPRPTNQVGNTAFHQQQRALHMQGRQNTTPRQAFIQDLREFISKLLDKHHDMVLGGDFNESLTDRNSGIHQLAASMQLVDPFLTKFPHQSEFGTHVLGHRRIDLCFVTPRLMPGIQHVGYAPFDFINNSDHRPLILDFHTRHLFGEPTDKLQSVSNRGVKTRDRKSVFQFITTMYEEISSRQGFLLQREVDEDQASPTVVEQLDEIIGKSGAIAEQKCKRRRPEFYSMKLVQQRIQVSILRAHLHSLKLGRDRTSQLGARMRRQGIDIPLPPTQQLTQKALHDAQVQLQDAIRSHKELRTEELETKIRNASMKGEKQRAKILRAIRKVETGQHTY